MVVLYFLVGLLAALIAAAPPGASNIAVINTTIKTSISKGLNIAYGAGFGEVFLAFFALQFSMTFSSFFGMNPWVEVIFISLFLLAGIYFIFKNHITFGYKNPKPLKKRTGSFLTGFLLAFLNPPVLIFWLLAFSVIHKYVIMVSENSSILTLALLFTGIYIGKVLVLYFYGKWGNTISKKEKCDTTKLYRIIGIALVTLSIIQGVNFVVS
ncbi:LysE family transporter [Patiriisocius hiemis]|uniref:LysE family transporter n=1 Tax=Patiriisocius hiemis TaxID=3075604 RepID=A0ABU2YFJ1_9FLAO|nr:LysE family transporter [Constantimarinum sp. W242]MDT0556954.1 LysE family transporter [Constantimarinum sp. W242]